MKIMQKDVSSSAENMQKYASAGIAYERGARAAWSAARMSDTPLHAACSGDRPSFRRSSRPPVRASHFATTRWPCKDATWSAVAPLREQNSFFGATEQLLSCGIPNNVHNIIENLNFD